jgi:hypothetical protein
VDPLGVPNALTLDHSSMIVVIVLVLYSLKPGATEIADTLPEVAPSGKDPFVKSGQPLSGVLA